MFFNPDDKTDVFIDGANFHATARGIRTEVDFRRLKTWLIERCNLRRVSYYTTVAQSDEFNSLRPLLDWLGYNGFSMVTKPSKEYTDATGRQRFKGSMVPELTCDMMRAADAGADHIVLFSGDGDLRYPVRCIKEKGVIVTVVSTMTTAPPFVADELRREADQFVDLADIIDGFARDPSLREAREKGRRSLLENVDGGAS